jgi:predicted RNase H-like HicB family nuclease
LEVGTEYFPPMTLRLVIEKDETTGRWSAVFPEVPGCASAGDTEQEALENAREALGLWFEPVDLNLRPGAKVVEVAVP